MKKITLLVITLLCSLVVQAQRNVPILSHPSSVVIKPLTNLNSRYRELNLSITPDGKYLYFMSTRGGQLWSRPRYDIGGFDGDIWYSKRNSGQWTNPNCLNTAVNTDKGEDEPSISSDGQTVYFESFANWNTRNGPYFSATLNGSHWGPKKGLGGGIHNFFMAQNRVTGTVSTDGMTVSPDGKTFIVASGKYTGNMNLYISKKNGGVWSYPRKLNISTAGNERSPFIAADGKTLYFASTGYSGKGGLDIFKCTLNSNGTASKVVNIGAPFNTSQNDAYFIMSSDGQEAYFCRNYNIYSANIKESPKDMKPQATLVISGIITDQDTKKPIRAKVAFKNAKGQVVATTFSNSSTGEYSIVINKVEKKYFQWVSKPTYKIFEKTLNVSYKGEGKNIVYANAALVPPGSKTKPNNTQVAQNKKPTVSKQQEEARKKEEARKQKEIAAQANKQKFQAFKKKMQKKAAKACVYKDFS